MSQSYLPTLTVTDGIAHVRLNRPDKLNSLTLPVLDELVAIAGRIRRDSSVRAVILAGEGRSFSAGLDFAAVPNIPESFNVLVHELRGLALDIKFD